MLMRTRPTCEINVDQSLSVVDLNERHSDTTNLIWSIVCTLAGPHYTCTPSLLEM